MLIKLLETFKSFKSMNVNLYKQRDSLNKSVKSILNLNSINNSVIDGIKVFGSDLKIIEFKQKSHQLKCFWPKCHYKTDRESHLERHKLIHKNKKRFKCNECNKELRQLIHLKTHKLIDSNDSNQRKYKCNECNKRFKRLPQLKIHRLIHSNKRNCLRLESMRETI